MKSIVTRIGDLRAWWMREYNCYGNHDRFRPNIVYLGKAEFRQLLREALEIPLNYQDIKVYGMRIKSVVDNNHLTVGRVVEEVD